MLRSNKCDAKNTRENDSEIALNNQTTTCYATVSGISRLWPPVVHYKSELLRHCDLNLSPDFKTALLVRDEIGITSVNMLCAFLFSSHKRVSYAQCQVTFTFDI